jgi:hypothetical protein
MAAEQIEGKEKANDGRTKNARAARFEDQRSPQRLAEPLQGDHQNFHDTGLSWEVSSLAHTNMAGFALQLETSTGSTGTN